jgi:hypothetical protein
MLGYHRWQRSDATHHREEDVGRLLRLASPTIEADRREAAFSQSRSNHPFIDKARASKTGRVEKGKGMSHRAEMEEARLVERIKAILIEQQVEHKCIDWEELAELLIDLPHEDLVALVDKLGLEKGFLNLKPQHGQ